MIDPTVLLVLAHLRGVDLPDPRQAECTARVVFAEARGEPALAQVVVAFTLRSRGTPCTVAKLHRQFAMRQPQGSSAKKEWRDAAEVAVLVLANAVANPLPGTTHFHDRTVKPLWGHSLSERGQIGRLSFYGPS